MIKIDKLSKNFGKNNVLKGVSFEVEEGDVIAIIGTSGSGKSTMLRCLIDLEQANGGTIEIDGKKLIQNGVYASTKEKKQITSNMGMVFQNFNLFPHLTVRANLKMPFLMSKKGSESQADELAKKLLAKVGLEDKIDSYPSKLSGGQQQRVAIARALMLNPKVMLFDEPTSALDPQLTYDVLNVMKQIAAEKVTMLVVTHEMSFARDVATKVVFMSDGIVEEIGSPEDIFKNPKSPKLKTFLSIEK